MTSIESALLESAEALADWGALLVIIGVAGEGLEVALKILDHKWKNEIFLNWYKKHEFLIEVLGAVFWFMVVIGLVMELKGSRGAQKLVKTENTRITKEAGAARKEAGEAIRQAADVNERANILESTNIALSTRLEEFRKANLELEALVSPRSLSPKQQKMISAALTQFQGHTVEVVSYGLDGEGASIGGQIISVLANAAINVVDRRTSTMMTGGLETGIHVRGPATEQPFVEAIARLLSSIGHQYVAVNTSPLQGSGPGGNVTFGGNANGGGSARVVGVAGPAPPGSPVSIMVGVKPFPNVVP